MADRSLWAPWYVIAWRALWIVPLYIARLLFVALCFAALGRRGAREAWIDTR